MSEQGNHQEIKITEPNPRSLSPLEHYFKGSTPEVKGKPLDVKTVMDNCIEAGHLTEEGRAMLRVISVQEDGLKEARKAREDRFYNPAIESLAFATLEGVPVITTIQLPRHISDDGLTGQSWKVEFNRTGGGEEVEAAQVDINPEFLNWFEISPEDSYMNLVRLKLK